MEMEDTGNFDKDLNLMRENHCEIERRRRLKMVNCISELSETIPSCKVSQKKLDKLTVLKKAVEEMNGIHGPKNSFPKDNFDRPRFLTDNEMKKIVLDAADGFLFVVCCRSGVVVHVTDTVTSVLNQSQTNWHGRHIFELVHPSDTSVVMQQLNILDENIAGRVIDVKSGKFKKEEYQITDERAIGSRIFVCRMRIGNCYPDSTKYPDRTRFTTKNSLGTSLDGTNYAVVHCSGYIRNLPDNEIFNEAENKQGNKSHYYLVAVGRLQMQLIPDPPKSSEFMTKHCEKGVFTFVDERIIPALGYKPNHLLGKSLIDSIHPEDQVITKYSFDRIVKMNGQPVFLSFRLKNKDNIWVWFRSESYAFLNPFSNTLEFIVCTHIPVEKNVGQQSVAMNHQLQNYSSQHQVYPTTYTYTSPSSYTPPQAQSTGVPRQDSYTVPRNMDSSNYGLNFQIQPSEMLPNSVYNNKPDTSLYQPSQGSTSLQSNYPELDSIINANSHCYNTELNNNCNYLPQQPVANQGMGLEMNVDSQGKYNNLSDMLDQESIMYSQSCMY